MITALISVTYVDESGKFWLDSHVKNRAANIVFHKDIHDAVVEILEESDDVEFSYDGRPQGRIYIDRNDESIHTGYTYRVKTDIENNRALFTAWVTISELRDFEFPPDNLEEE